MPHHSGQTLVIRKQFFSCINGLNDLMMHLAQRHSVVSRRRIARSLETQCLQFARRIHEFVERFQKMTGSK